MAFPLPTASLATPPTSHSLFHILGLGLNEPVFGGGQIPAHALTDFVHLQELSVRALTLLRCTLPKHFLTGAESCTRVAVWTGRRTRAARQQRQSLNETTFSSASLFLFLLFASFLLKGAGGVLLEGETGGRRSCCKHQYWPAGSIWANYASENFLQSFASNNSVLAESLPCGRSCCVVSCGSSQRASSPPDPRHSPSMTRRPRDRKGGQLLLKGSYLNCFCPRAAFDKPRMISFSLQLTLR